VVELEFVTEQPPVAAAKSALEPLTASAPIATNSAAIVCARRPLLSQTAAVFPREWLFSEFWSLSIAGTVLASAPGVVRRSAHKAISSRPQALLYDPFGHLLS
jgi:hypothetical protein